jgi:hypothetical protein
MLPDCQARLLKAQNELSDMLKLLVFPQNNLTVQINNEVGEIPEEITVAQSTLESTLSLVN